MRLIPITGIIFAAVIAAAVPARAAPVLVDFTNNQTWNGASDGALSFSTVISGITVTVSAYRNGQPHPMTFNTSSSERSGCLDGHSGNPAHDLTCHGDGIGIKGTAGNSGAADDEITEGGSERLLVEFSTPVNLTNVELLDLFNNNTEMEVALIKLDSGNYQSFMSNDNLGGYYSTHLGSPAVSRIWFKANNDAFSDYAVARLSIYMNDVPEPGTAALFIFGLAGLKTMRRRLRKSSTDQAS
ncbi:MAG: PEP-CTERM sorting domain-containing protein [Rhodobacteraceae bacterium]|nr:PEP-CTERM sorting domain-containing protein [Paracoccaceae bacterium]